LTHFDRISKCLFCARERSLRIPKRPQRTVAREQQAKSFELRAAIRMARLWREQGKRDKARSTVDR
jgi:hypothetical protein